MDIYCAACNVCLIFFLQWYTNETFDMLTLRWGSQGTPELFALFNWRDPATKDDGGSRLYVSHDFGVTFGNVTEKLQCALQTKPTSLSSIYWTDATTKTVRFSDEFTLYIAIAILFLCL